MLAKDGNLSIPRYVKTAKRGERRAGDARRWRRPGPRSTTSGREFWQQMDALVDMLDGVVAEEDADA